MQKSNLTTQTFLELLGFSRTLESDWLRPRLGMPDQIQAERLNQLVGSYNALSHEKNQGYGLIIAS